MSLLILSSMVLMKLEILKDSTDAFMRFYAHFEVLHYKRFIETGKNLLNFTKKCLCSLEVLSAFVEKELRLVCKLYFLFITAIYNVNY